ncbi:tetratricopeptide repeat protein [Gordonia terrae]
MLRSSMVWFRKLSALTVVGITAAFFTTATAILTIAGAPSWGRYTVAGLGFVVLAIEALVKLRDKRRDDAAAQAKENEAREASEAERDRRIGDALLEMPTAVNDVDPVALGVVKSQTASRLDIPELPAYIDRDIDKLAEQRLRKMGSVLLIGDPASGVTRTAYELAKRTVPNSLVIAPRAPDGLRTLLSDHGALSTLAPETPVLLWFDRIHEFGPKNVTASMLQQCLEHNRGSRIVATVPSGTAYQAWSTDNPRLATQFGEPVRVRRLPSPREIERAQKVYSNIDFTEGIAAAFVALPRLIQHLNAGFHDCPFEPVGGVCDLATELVVAAIQWSGTGTPRALPLELFPSVDTRNRPRQPDPEHLTAALEWTTKAIVEGASLLDPDQRRPESAASVSVRVHSYLTDGIANDPSYKPPKKTWRAAIKEAVAAEDSDSIGRIFFTAHITGEHEHRNHGWAQITSINEPAARWLERCIAYDAQRHDAIGIVEPLSRMLELQTMALGPNDLEVARTLNVLGNAWQELGNYTRSRKLHDRALAIVEHHYPDDIEVARTLNGLGNSWRNLGDLARTRKLHERALAFLEHRYPDDIEVARTLTSLGTARQSLGDYAQAKELHERALYIFEGHIGPNSAPVATTLINLGHTQENLGDYALAKEHFERSLTIANSLYGPKHVTVAKAHGHLGNALRSLGNYAQAKVHHERALAGLERHYGPKHIGVARTLSDLGYTLDFLNDTERARELHERALALQERHYGPRHIEVAKTLTNLGNSLQSLGNFARARKLYERALVIFERNLDPNHTHVAIVLSALGTILYRENKLQPARKNCLRALNIYQTHRRDEMVARLSSDIRLFDPALVLVTSDDGRIVALENRQST